MKRKGLGKGKGKGFKNIIPKDPRVHSDSAKGRKQPQKVQYIKEPFGLPFELTEKDKFKNPKKYKQSKAKIEQMEIVNMFKNYMKKHDWDEDFKKSYGGAFDDVRMFTDREMTSEYNKDETRGWTGVMSGVVDKKKDSNVVLLVTYDGSGYDTFSDPNIQYQFQEMLDKKFGKEKYMVEAYTNWAFQVYKG